MTRNALYYGDNLAVLREAIKEASVDLVYLDPPFNSQATYNLLFKSPAGMGSQAQIEAFEDTWHWGVEAESAFEQVMRFGNTEAADLLRAMRSFLGDTDMMAYVAMMAVRLLELHRVLKPSGSLYLHCDPTASHYLKLLLDSIFGPTAFQNEIIWKRTGAHGSAKRWGPIHDVILFYTKGRGHVWNRVLQDYDPAYVEKEYKHSDATGVYRRVTLTGAGTRKGDSGKPWRGTDPTLAGRHWAVPTPLLVKRFPDINIAALTTQERLDLLDSAGLIHWPKIVNGVPQLKRYLAETEGAVIQDIILDINPLNKPDRERLGYPTQKPLALLERIIAASSNPDGIILDPFCGCGTTIHAAQKLGRTWIGIDVTHLAISLIERRLKDAFPAIAFDVHGTPTDLEGARDLALRDKYQFQWWAVSLVEAQPYGGKKKGADGGIDGIIYFRSDAKTTERAVVSVKGGGVSVPMIRDLKGVLDREKAPIGVFLTLEPPTRPMEREAASAGFYTLGDRQYPRLQIITVEQALNGTKPAIPLIDTGAAFRRATRETTAVQPKLI
ncbi:DNA methyltransferase [Falsiroseomonas sp. E2-1-a20]|uniref:DNA methyltransferase n=1 Tax=Falsiroseomonas sp. E2-1-a20 TaxID=3239300 RepID=UPI003F2CFD7E